MKVFATAAALLLLAPLAPRAQAQSWSQLLGDLPGQSVAMATRQALAVDDEGQIHVQTAQVAGNGARTGRLYTLNGYGDPQPGLSTQVPLAAITTARAVDARGGYRLSWYDYGTQPLIFFYDPGQAVHDRSISFGLGVELKLLASDGNDGAVVVYEDAAIAGKPRVSLLGGSSIFRWSRLIGGCPSNDFLPVKVLAADFVVEPVPHIAVITRCEASAAQGGGRVTLKYVDAVSGDTLSTRSSWPYADNDDPIVAAYAIGAGRFLVEQADSLSGDRSVRVVGIDSENDALPMPANFRLQPAVRSAGITLIPTIDEERRSLGMLKFEPKQGDWIEYPELGDLLDLDLAWGVVPGGAGAVAYKLPQADGRGPVRVLALDASGRVLSKRNVDSLPTRAGGRIELLGAGGDQLLLAVDVQRADGRGAVHVEQFGVDSGIGTIPLPPRGPIALPSARLPTGE